MWFRRRLRQGFCVCPIAGAPGAGEGFDCIRWPGMFIPVPVTKYAFSSSVIAAITFFIGSLPSFGDFLSSALDECKQAENNNES